MLVLVSAGVGDVSGGDVEVVAGGDVEVVAGGDVVVVSGCGVSAAVVAAMDGTAVVVKGGAVVVIVVVVGGWTVVVLVAASTIAFAPLSFAFMALLNSSSFFIRFSNSATENSALVTKMKAELITRSRTSLDIAEAVRVCKLTEALKDDLGSSGH